MIDAILDFSPIVLALAIWTWVIRDAIKGRRDRREATDSLRRARGRNLGAWVLVKGEVPRGPDGLPIPPPEVAEAIDRILDHEIAAELDRRARLNNSNDESSTRKENEND